MSLHRQVSSATLTLLRGDITEQETEAIVNAANSGLLGGGGVDGAIHRAGGPGILEECRKIREQKGECPPGEAVITGGGNLKARFIIHAVGPVWHGGGMGEEELLGSAYRNSLILAAGHRIRTIAFPSISTGAYGFPIDRASKIAFDTVSGFLKNDSPLEEVRFVVYSQEDYEVYAFLF
jgi:O-acetyl-ADP-ribose deacetylase (regulator of RNase III)